MAEAASCCIRENFCLKILGGLAKILKRDAIPKQAFVTHMAAVVMTSLPVMFRRVDTNKNCV
jgi:hypothetical protein